MNQLTLYTSLCHLIWFWHGHGLLQRCVCLSVSSPVPWTRKGNSIFQINSWFVWSVVCRLWDDSSMWQTQGSCTCTARVLSPQNQTTALWILGLDGKASLLLVTHLLLTHLALPGVVYLWERRAADEKLLEIGAGKGIAPWRAPALLWDGLGVVEVSVIPCLELLYGGNQNLGKNL